MPILATKAFWNVDALERQRELNAWTWKQKLKPTDVLYVIEFPLKDKIKAIDKQMGTQRGNRGYGSCGFGGVYQCGKINFNECHREK
jgi:hypothetical protein